MEGAALDPRDLRAVAMVFAVVLDGSLPPSGVRTHHHFPFMTASKGTARTMRNAGVQLLALHPSSGVLRPCVLLKIRRSNGVGDPVSLTDRQHFLLYQSGKDFLFVIIRDTALKLKHGTD